MADNNKQEQQQAAIPASFEIADLITAGYLPPDVDMQGAVVRPEWLNIGELELSDAEELEYWRTMRQYMLGNFSYVSQNLAVRRCLKDVRRQMSVMKTAGLSKHADVNITNKLKAMLSVIPRCATLEQLNRQSCKLAELSRAELTEPQLNLAQRLKADIEKQYAVLTLTSEQSSVPTSAGIEMAVNQQNNEPQLSRTEQRPAIREDKIREDKTPLKWGSAGDASRGQGFNFLGLLGYYKTIITSIEKFQLPDDLIARTKGNGESDESAIAHIKNKLAWLCSNSQNQPAIIQALHEKDTRKLSAAYNSREQGAYSWQAWLCCNAIESLTPKQISSIAGQPNINTFRAIVANEIDSHIKTDGDAIFHTIREKIDWIKQGKAVNNLKGFMASRNK